MYPDRLLQACLQKGWTEYKKTKSARRRSLSFFHIVARAPPARRVGNADRPNPPMAKLGNADRPNPPKGEAGECRGSIPQKWRCDSTPSRTKIVRAPKHYSAAHRVSLLRHPPIGNTRSRTKPQTHTPKINTNCAIDFN